MNKEHSSAIKSSAVNPDLNWSQVRETILMLGVAIGQIDAVMRDGDESVGVLTSSFTAMSNAVAAISVANQDLPDDEATRLVRETIESKCGFVFGQMQHAIMAFQFYDRMVQRLNHVCHSIDALADLISDGSRLYSPAEWVSIQKIIRSKYSMESERIMFDSILNGASIHEALELSRRWADAERGKGDEIELF
ncbi:MAG: hypothetical protein PHG47_11535 [Sulfuricella sp.]|nr:hypothetical protein [Sulfuricella sp.]